MITHLRSVLLFCSAGLLLVLWPLSSHADEPEYRGRELSSWLQDFAIGRFPDMEKDRDAVQAIRAIGADAIPVLTERLKTTSSSLDFTQDIHTVSAFESLGAEARLAIPDLIELLAPAYDAARESTSEPSARLNDRKSDAAAGALRAIGRDSVPPLIEALDAEKTEIRFGAAMALVNFSSQAKDVVPALIKALEDNDCDVRWRAARSLGMLRAMPEVTVPALVGRLHDDPATNVRCYAMMALGKFGSMAKSSATDLRKATTDDDPVIRSYAKKALKQVEAIAPEKVEDCTP